MVGAYHSLQEDLEQLIQRLKGTLTKNIWEELEAFVEQKAEDKFDTIYSSLDHDILCSRGIFMIDCLMKLPVRRWIQRKSSGVFLKLLTQKTCTATFNKPFNFKILVQSMSTFCLVSNTKHMDIYLSRCPYSHLPISSYHRGL